MVLSLKEKDMVNNPSYYTNDKHECIEVMREMFGDEVVKHFCMCNAFKYMWRQGKKDNETLEKDRAKSQWYINYMMDNFCNDSNNI